MILNEFIEEYKLNMDEIKQHYLDVEDQHTLLYGKAGSGKTFLLLARIAYLMKSGKASSDEILNLVYDSEGARKMAKDYRYAYCDDELMPSFVDFHSFCYRIIRFHDKQCGKESCKAYRDMEKVIRKLIKDMFVLDLKNQDLRRLMRKVSYCKNMMLPEREIMKIEFDGIDFPAFYKAYEKFKSAKSIYDQDDILVETAQILMNKPEILQLYQSRYKFIHVDDAEELSFVSHVILKLMASNQNILFAVADKEQCIDMDHCAYMEALDSFTETYGIAQIGYLRKNYRNNKTIVQTANMFMFKHNTDEYLQTDSEEECDIKFKGFSELNKLYEYALRKVMEDDDEIAFLYHDFAIAVPLIDTFQSNQVPFFFQGNVKKFLQDAIVRDICNFIELFIDPKDMRAFYEIYPKMGLDISNKVLLEISDRLRTDESVDVYQALMESSYKSAGKKKLSSNMENIRMASMKNTLGMIEFIFDKLNYRERLLKNGIMLNNANIIALKVLADRYHDPIEFLSKLKLLGDFQCEPVSRIHIRSVSSSKGMEFNKICMVDCMASTFPMQNCTEGELKEERHLFFVGLTRAKHGLEVFTAKRCFTTRLEISPFLYEIHPSQDTEEISEQPVVQPRKLKENTIRRGMKIIHTTLGKGSVLKVSEGMMQVRFMNETKTLNIKLCLKNSLIERA